MTHNTNSSEPSVCVFSVSLCVVPIAVWLDTVPLCRLIGPSLKSQAPLLSSSGFRGLPLGLTLGCQLEIWNNYSSICKISIKQCIITPIGLRKPPQNSSVSWDLLKKCQALYYPVHHLSRHLLLFVICLWVLLYLYTWTHQRLEPRVAILNILTAELC